jgi:hypothetical protein
MIKELEMAVYCAPHLPEDDQAKLAEAILAILERQGLIERDTLETIVF